MEGLMKLVRKSILVLFLAVLILSFEFSVYAAALSKNYLNARFNYSMKYPNNYVVKTVIKPNGETVVFSSSVEDKVMGFSPSVNVVATELGKNDTNDLELFSDRAKKGIIKAWGNAEFLEQKKEKLNGLDVYKLVSTSKQQKAVFKFMQLLLINNNKAYVLTYSALDSQYNGNLSEAKAIINSFKINK
jgi:eukaryotic-like serine/threonine-protein kinase